MPSAPSGTVTFLFTDIEGSTDLWDRQPERMQAALARHDALVRAALQADGGFVFKTIGDAFCAAFADAAAALRAALAIQTALNAEDWGDLPVRARIALHTGVAQQRDDDYFGPALNRVARLRDAGHGGQVLLSLATEELVRERLPRGGALRDLGEHALRGLARPERVYQLLHGGLHAEFASLRSDTQATGNLPSAATPLIGREAECEAARAAILADDVRVLTLTGPGGTGKTRLAIEVAASLQGRFSDGAFFVDLAPVADASLVPAAVAAALGVRETGGRTIEESLLAYLSERTTLLLLDNFEQVIEAGPFAARISQAQQVKMIVTSREALRIYGEREFAVPPLDVPPAEASGPAELLRSSCVRLFVERARAVRRDFALSDANAGAVGEICRRLDGLPLAIELAAARIRLLSADALLARLGSRLELLTGGARDRSERQQTLRAAIAWSHDLLGPAEQAFFSQLAVFAGGCNAEAVAAVGETAEASAAASFDLLSSLVEKSLLRADEGAGGEPRFLMLETIREFALERLAASGLEPATRGRHARHYLAVVEASAPLLRGPEQPAAMALLASEHDNIRLALHWLNDSGDATGALRLVAGMWSFWHNHGHFSEGRAWIERALALPRGDDALLRARAGHGLAVLAYKQGDVDAARTVAEENVREWERLGDRVGRAIALTNLSAAIWTQGDVAVAEALASESVRDLRAAGDEWGLADALHYAGHYAMDRGDHEASRRVWTEALALFERCGDPSNVALPMKDLGLIAARAGDYDTARRMYEESLALLRASGDKWQIAESANRTGELALFEGEPDLALARFDEGLALFRELGNVPGMIESLNHRAEVVAMRGDLADARSLYEDCLRMSQDVGNERLVAAMQHNLARMALRYGESSRAAALFAESLERHRKLGRDGCIALCLGGLGLTTAAMGRLDAGARLLGAADALAERSGGALGPCDRIEHDTDHAEFVARVRAQLGDAAFDAAWAAGAAMPVEDAIAEATRDMDRATPP